MEQKIQELTEKIYQEGVEKGEAQAKKIIAEAQEKAAAIVADAKARAEKSIAEAGRQALEMKRNTEAEIRLAGGQAVSAIKQRIADLICAKLIDANLTSALSDPGTVKELVFAVVKNWKADAGAPPRLEVLLPVQKQEELRKAFEKGASDLMKKGLAVAFTKAIKAGFQIGPKGGSFKISLSDEDFAEFMKEHLRPKTYDYLFGG